MHSPPSRFKMFILHSTIPMDEQEQDWIVKWKQSIWVVWNLKLGNLYRLYIVTGHYHYRYNMLLVYDVYKSIQIFMIVSLLMFAHLAAVSRLSRSFSNLLELAPGFSGASRKRFWAARCGSKEFSRRKLQLFQEFEVSEQTYAKLLRFSYPIPFHLWDNYWHEVWKSEGKQSKESLIFLQKSCRLTANLTKVCHIFLASTIAESSVTLPKASLTNSKHLRALFNQEGQV